MPKVKKRLNVSMCEYIFNFKVILTSSFSKICPKSTESNLTVSPSSPMLQGSILNVEGLRKAPAIFITAMLRQTLAVILEID